MKAVDTNVLARFLLQDDERQVGMATDLLTSPVWVPITVWLELGWVLGKQLKLDRHVISDALETLLGLDAVHTADRDGLHWAIDRFRAGADWADMVHLINARGHADSFHTFDTRMRQQAGASSPLKIEPLP